ncbi:flagellar basal body rod protein FlgB [Endozoicomonas sp.]|uniref:flagellar basal body rod protein FlgB n=1 Tax=Endozoicomonas sp. TaxID=1892382 RepID=UPI00383B49F6
MLMSFEAALGIHPTMTQLRSTQIAVQSGNVFNSETPGYRAMGFNLQLTEALAGLALTNKRHISNKLTPETNLTLRNSGDNTSANGNDVSLPMEQAELARAMAGFNISLALVRERLTMLDKVIAGR